MEDLSFRKRLIRQEIEIIRGDMAKNQEFIMRFQKQNDGYLSSIDEKLKELNEIDDRLLTLEKEKLAAIVNQPM